MAADASSANDMGPAESVAPGSEVPASNESAVMGAVGTETAAALDMPAASEKPGEGSAQNQEEGQNGEGQTAGPDLKVAPRPAQLEIGEEVLEVGSARSLSESAPVTARSTESSTAGNAATRRHRQRRKHTPVRAGTGEVATALPHSTPTKTEPVKELATPQKTTPKWLSDSRALSPIPNDSRAHMLDASFGQTGMNASRAGTNTTAMEVGINLQPSTGSMPWYLKHVVGFFIGSMLLIFVGGLVAGTSRNEATDPLHPPAPLGREGCSFYFCAGDVSSGFFSAGTVSTGVFSAASSVSVGAFSTGFVSMGIVSIGFCSVGIVSFGVFSLGLISFGHIVLGLWAWGSYAFYKKGGRSAINPARYRYEGGDMVAYTSVLQESVISVGPREERVQRGGSRPGMMDVENSLAGRSAELREDLEAAGRATDRSESTRPE